MRRGKRYVSILMTVVIAVVMFPGGMTSVTAESGITEAETAYVKGKYSEYLALYTGQESPDCVVEVMGGDYVSTGDGISAAVYLGSQNGALISGQSTWAEYEIDVPREGMYNIKVSYATTQNSKNDIKIGVMINSETPFPEASGMRLPRLFEDTTAIRSDANANELRPKQDMRHTVLTKGLRSGDGSYSDDFKFYFKEGYNSLVITSNGVEFFLDTITLYQKEEIISYDEYIRKNAGSSDSSGQLAKIQAELSKNRAGASLYPSYDRVNAATEDARGNLNNPSKIKINQIGGKFWDAPDQYITWDIEVPEDGFYYLALKYKQDTLDGLFCSRDVYIDGEIPFRELRGARFTYSLDWQVKTLGDASGTPYKIYLTKGVHEIKMEYTLGDLTDIIRQAQEILTDINELYRQIVMVTGPKPDVYTDYFLETVVPGLEQTLATNYDKIDSVLTRLYEVTNARGSKLAALDALKTQIGLFIKDTEEIHKKLPSFKNNISALGAWVVDNTSQPIALDYIALYSPDTPEPKAAAPLVSGMVYSVRRFLSSFDKSNDYISDADAENRSVKVWVNSTSSGRDQAQVLKDLVEDSFTPETGIHVNLELVQGSLIEATIAGRGPDVALTSSGEQTVNFAIRGALYDLKNFADYDEIMKRFYDSATVQFEYQGGGYGVPETQVFSMFFYRTDVFKELNIKPPKTWDDLYTIIPVIQRNNLQLTIPAISASKTASQTSSTITVDSAFTSLLYQNGGRLYNEDGSAALLDAPNSIEAFKTYTNFFTNYEFPQESDFYTRFRNGEIVASIQPYNMYNRLMVGAPEISGLWAMTDIMGMPRGDGELDISQTAAATAAIIFNNAKDKEAAWEFIKWWSRADIQAAYGIELEALMGPSARYTPANVETLALLPWTASEADALYHAWSYTAGIPNVPGSYYTSRSLMNAFRRVTYSGVSPREALIIQNKYLNDEITRKRTEFGLDAASKP